MNKTLLFFIVISLMLASCQSVPSQDLAPTADLSTPIMSSLPLPSSAASVGVNISSPIPLPSSTISVSTPTSTPFSSPTPRTPVCAMSHPAPDLFSLELYGNFHTIGVSISFPANSDPENNALAYLEYKKDDGEFQAGFPLTRINNTQFVGSIFWLQPDTSYEVQVTFLDSQSPLDCAVVRGKGNTRSEPVIPESSLTLYVSPNGNGKSCSTQEPCGFSTALAKSGPGFTIILRAGTYYEGNITVNKGGEDGNPLIIQSFPGEEVVFDGGEPDALKWDMREPGIYSTRITDAGTYLVFAGKRAFTHIEAWKI